MDSLEGHEIVTVVLLVAFVILGALDILSTFIGIAYHNFSETNPLAIYFMSKLGLLPGLLLLKSAFVGIIGGTAYVALTKTRSFVDDDLLIGALLILNIFGLFVLSSNFGLLGWPFFFHYSM